jgi:hypothetical protein
MATGEMAATASQSAGATASYTGPNSSVGAIPIVLLGLGGVGRTLVQHILRTRHTLAQVGMSPSSSELPARFRPNLWLGSAAPHGLSLKAQVKLAEEWLMSCA